MLTRAQTDMIVQKNRRNKEEEDTVSVHVQNKNKSDDILDSFRTKDVRDLAKSLSKDKTVKEKNGTTLHSYQALTFIIVRKSSA